MSFRSEIEEELEAQEQEKKRRNVAVSTIQQYCRDNDIDFSPQDKDRILHSEDYLSSGGFSDRGGL